MKLAIIVGSVQRGNGSTKTAAALTRAATEQAIDAAVVGIDAFTDMFRGDYIYFDSANPDQRQVMETLAASDALLFVVPTYFKSLSGALKNFFDLIREKSVYEHKVFGFVASNHKNQDFGARHAEQIVQGILEFFETQGVFVPEISIINPEAIDFSVAERAVKAIAEMEATYQPVA